MDAVARLVKRQTRAESAAATRARLLEAAGDLFAEVGFTAATIDEIVRRAGFTRGAFYAHFDDKADAFVTLIEQGRDEDLARVRSLLAITPPDQTTTVVQNWFDDLNATNRWGLAYAELWPQTLGNDALRARLAARQTRVREAIAEMIDDFCRAEGPTLPIPLDQVASMMLALGEGFGAHRHLDPETLPPDAFTTAVALLWTGLLHPTT